MGISTKGGDKGKTSLMFGRRVEKFCTRVCAYGAVDELSCALGLARAFASDSNVKLAGEILEIQKTLVSLMTELATDSCDAPKLAEKNIALLSEENLLSLEKKIAELEADGNALKEWKIPGASKIDAALNIARATCRKAEREIARLNAESPLERPIALAYINRLSDLLFLYSASV